MYFLVDLENQGVYDKIKENFEKVNDSFWLSLICALLCGTIFIIL